MTMVLDRDEVDEATDTDGLDPRRLRTLRLHAGWVRRITAETAPDGARLLSHGELVSWRDALDDLLTEVRRLRRADSQP